MQKKILAVVIANTIAVANAAAPDSDLILAASQADEGKAAEHIGFDFPYDFSDEYVAQSENPTFLGMTLAGNVKTSFEYESKRTRNYNGPISYEYIKINEIGSLYLEENNFNIRGTYSLKTANYKQQDARGVTRSTDSLKHLLLLDKPIPLGGGWETGFAYEMEFEDKDIYDVIDSYHTTTYEVEQIYRPYLSYHNNRYNVGFYSHFEWLTMDFRQPRWGDREESGYSLLFKPHYTYGPFRFELEFFYQKKDNNKTFTPDGRIAQGDNFIEKYIEPTIRYSLDSGGNVYVNARFTKKKTSETGGTWGPGEQYFTNAFKTTVGYEQDISQNWQVKGEYEYTREKETTNASWANGTSKKLDQHKVYVQALYRF